MGVDELLIQPFLHVADDESRAVELVINSPLQSACMDSLGRLQALPTLSVGVVLGKQIELLVAHYRQKLTPSLVKLSEQLVAIMDLTCTLSGVELASPMEVTTSRIEALQARRS